MPLPAEKGLKPAQRFANPAVTRDLMPLPAEKGLKLVRAEQNIIGLNKI